MTSSTPDESTSLYDDTVRNAPKEEKDQENNHDAIKKAANLNCNSPEPVKKKVPGGGKRRKPAQGTPDPPDLSANAATTKRRRMLQTGDFQREISIQIGFPAGGGGAGDLAAPGPSGDPGIMGGSGDDVLAALFLAADDDDDHCHPAAAAAAALGDAGDPDDNHDDNDDDDTDDPPSQASSSAVDVLSVTGDSLPPTSELSPGISDLSGLSGHDLHPSEVDVQTDPASSEADTIYYNTSSDGEAGATPALGPQSSSTSSLPAAPSRVPSARRHLDFSRSDESLRRATRAVARGRDREALRTAFDAED